MTIGSSVLQTDSWPAEIQKFVSAPSFGPRQARLAVVSTAVACASFLIVFALGGIPDLTNQMGTRGEMLILFFAAFIIGCGFWVWFLFGRVIHDRAARVSVSPWEIRVSFPDSPDATSRWTDPLLRIVVTQVWADPTKPWSIQMTVGNRQAYASTSQDGFSRLEEAAHQAQRSFEKQEKGKPPQNWSVWTLVSQKQ